MVRNVTLPRDHAGDMHAITEQTAMNIAVMSLLLIWMVFSGNRKYKEKTPKERWL